jgi:hypothetical protein
VGLYPCHDTGGNQVGILEMMVGWNLSRKWLDRRELD